MLPIPMIAQAPNLWNLLMINTKLVFHSVSTYLMKWATRPKPTTINVRIKNVKPLTLCRSIRLSCQFNCFKIMIKAAKVKIEINDPPIIWAQ